MIDLNKPKVLMLKKAINKACAELLITALELNDEHFAPNVEFYGHSYFLNVSFMADNMHRVVVEKYRIYGQPLSHLTQKAYLSELKSILIFIEHIKTALIEHHAHYVWGKA